MPSVTEATEHPQQYARESIVEALLCLVNPSLAEQHEQAAWCIAESVTLAAIAAGSELVRAHEGRLHAVMRVVACAQRNMVRTQLRALKRGGWVILLRREARWNEAGECIAGWSVELSCDHPEHERFIGVWRNDRVDAIVNAIAAV